MKKRKIITAAILLIAIAGCKVRQMEQRVKWDSSMVQGKLIVTFPDTMRKVEMEHRFRRQQLKAVMPLAEHLDIWLFRYDSLRISPQRMAAKLLVKGFVTSVEFDKKYP